MLRNISVISVGECGGERTVEEDPDDNERASERQASPARFSLHALRRAARRNVVPDAIEYVLTYGRMLHRTGITFHFLAARDVPAEDRRAAWAARLVGTVVLVETTLLRCVGTIAALVPASAEEAGKVPTFRPSTFRAWVLVGADGGIITVYRNRRALPAIRRKLKYRIAVGAEPVASEMLGLEDGERPLTA